MRISSVKFWLLRLSSRDVRCCNSELRKFGQKVFYSGVESEKDPKVLALQDKLVYCDYLHREKASVSYLKWSEMRRKEYKLRKEAEYDKIAYEPVHSVMLSSDVSQEDEDIDTYENTEKRMPVHMPYAMVDSYKTIDSKDDFEEADIGSLNEKYKDLYEKYLEAKRSGKDAPDLKSFMENAESKDTPKGELWKVPGTWMSDYEQFDDSLIDVAGYKNYGTADPDSRVSYIPCGGCGALLHCRDPAIPGYLPSELFSGRDEEDLKSMVCQRCHFLKFYNAALEVKVSIEDYPKLLSVIKRRKCAIMLIVDLTDFPCSIWPDLTTIMHPFTPIYLVGNKIDLLPRDSTKFLENVKQCLVDTVVDVTRVKRENITHVQLVSAKTGYGIEQLINKLQFKWRYKGDVYLIGCTNVGKSTLFNSLLNSDYCKVQAVDLIQRATVSAWPGTTLNLLKFPILNPTEKKVFLRIERLKQEAFYRMEIARYRDYQYKTTRKLEFATLQDHVGRTFTGNTPQDIVGDPFSERSHKFLLRKEVFDESQPEYEQSRWCYDTPGTVHRDQILDLLTTDELLLTLPQRIISPRTFKLMPRQTVFVAGMGRLDYLDGEYSVRCTLFASKELPITICYTVDADEIYNELLESEAFVVPKNDPERLKVWPKLEWKEEMRVTGAKGVSVADVVLSSIGWVSIAPYENEEASLKAWTPEGRGIYFRSPALLSRSVRLRGAKVPGTPMFLPGRQVYVKG